jgi:predicted nucleic acid-binding Zn ribbon protein
MHCSNCGYQNHEDSKFCINCGTPLKQAKPPERKKKKSAILSIASIFAVAVVILIVTVLWRAGYLDKKSQTAIARDQVVAICEGYLNGQYDAETAEELLNEVLIPDTTGGDNLAMYIGIIQTNIHLRENPLGNRNDEDFQRIIEDIKNMMVDYPSLDAERGATNSAKPYADGRSKDDALAEAHIYLQIGTLSYDMLIDLLESNGYTSENAKYAADNCGADWYANALEAALETLGRSSTGNSISYDTLVFLLEAQGFTHDQAVYAADQALSE